MEAIRLRPQWGKPHILIGNLYVESANSCGENAFEKKAVYWLAIAEFKKALGDEESAKKARKLIKSYTPLTPNKTLIFPIWLYQKEILSNQVLDKQKRCLTRLKYVTAWMHFMTNYKKVSQQLYCWVMLFSCENRIEDIPISDEEPKHDVFVEDIHMVYTDSGKARFVIKAPELLAYNKKIITAENSQKV